MPPAEPSPGKPSSPLDIRVIFCGNFLGHLKTLPTPSLDLICIDPFFNSYHSYDWHVSRCTNPMLDRLEAVLA